MLLCAVHSDAQKMLVRVLQLPHPIDWLQVMHSNTKHGADAQYRDIVHPLMKRLDVGERASGSNGSIVDKERIITRT